MKNDAFVGRILYTFVLTAGLALAAPTSSAQNVGFAGPSYVGSGSFPTGAKAQSKLWFHDGKWWGSLWSEAERRFTIHRYETSSHTWTDTGVIIDPRHNSHSDCMMEGNKLYVGSHRFLTNANEVGNPIGLYRFTYVDGPDTYTLDPGFPVVIGDERLTLEVAQALLDRGVYAPAIRPPTVPQGSSRIRLTVTAEHSREHLDQVLGAFRDILKSRPLM